MKTKIKICGIRDLESAQVAIANGADFLGFNFVTASKRRIDFDKAKDIIGTLRVDSGKTRFVGIFQNASTHEVNAIARTLKLDYVQLHGEENEIYMTKINNKIIKKVSEEDPCFFK